MAKEILTVRDVDEEIWRKFRAKTEENRTGAERGADLLDKKEGKGRRLDPRNFLRVQGVFKTGKFVRWSEEVDRTLYGYEG